MITQVFIIAFILLHMPTSRKVSLSKTNTLSIKSIYFLSYTFPLNIPNQNNGSVLIYKQYINVDFEYRKFNSRIKTC